MSTATPLTVKDIAVMNGAGLDKHIPSPTDYAVSSPAWTEAEYPYVDRASGRVVAGFWTGEPGFVEIDSWAYTEVCSILSGKVAVVDQEGGRVEFGAGEAFMVPKGFAGTWVTIEASTKIFIAIQ
jgi:uncharacterized cupin superfamily protein